MRSRTATWFVCKIRYEKMQENGIQKKVTEQYVVDALSFAEAEARIFDKMSQYVSGEIEVADISRAPFGEIFFMRWEAKVLEKDVEKIAASIRRKDKEAFQKWENETLEEKFKDTDTRWYKSKLQFITVDERTGNEKRSNTIYLVEGCSLENARNNIDEVMGKTMIDYVIVGVNETTIMDVFEYKKKSE